MAQKKDKEDKEEKEEKSETIIHQEPLRATVQMLLIQGRLGK
uniref:Uncharacterized protein n=1 Tax=Ditylenchus dipsaci TaxID=166011 RepID=A0A915CMP5_9BILA